MTTLNSSYNFENSVDTVAEMFDFAVNYCDFDGDKFWNMFICSKIADKFENQNPKFVLGKSGEELVYDIADKMGISISENNRSKNIGRSPEYWAGWALAQYQIESKKSYKKIHEVISFNELCNMYNPLHEAPVEKVFDILNERSKKLPSALKIQRQRAGLSQTNLANISGISARTIQAYEQNDRDISQAKIEILSNLADALSCTIDDIK